MIFHQDILDTLKETSRTFFIPISRLPHGLQEAVASAYLCMRAIDEIEDHPHLDKLSKIGHLATIGQLLQAQTSVATFALDDFSAVMRAQQGVLPEVTMRIGEWACLAPEAIAPRIWDATATMAERMAHWVADDWKIQTKADLDRYTFGVAGAVGLLLCDLWAWYDGVQMNRMHAIQFGRGLQAVNMLRNRDEDLARNVDYFPAGWTQEHMQEYAYYNLLQAEAYTRTLPPGPVAYFIKIPLVLAYETLQALARGESKLSRSAVLQIIQHIHFD
jgi:farnesyl-diphosphate farnesyltransferase